MNVQLVAVIVKKIRTKIRQQNTEKNVEILPQVHVHYCRFITKESRYAFEYISLTTLNWKWMKNCNTVKWACVCSEVNS